MKKTNILSWAVIVLLLFSFLLSFTSCKSTESEIVLQKMPDRCLYYIGESPDISGAELCIRTSGKQETLPLTSDMLGDEWDTVFTEAGKFEFSVIYENKEFKFSFFVDDDLEAHKAFALSSITNWADKSIIEDEITADAIADAKKKILESEDHASVIKAKNDALVFSSDYTELILKKQALESAKNEALDFLASLDISVFTYDYENKLSSVIAESVTLIEEATTTDRVHFIKSEFVKKTEEMSSDSHNEAIFKLEESFELQYGKNKVYYDPVIYDSLISELIRTETQIREMFSDTAVAELSDNFLNVTAKAFNTYPDLIYKKLSELDPSELDFDRDYDVIKEITDDILTLVFRVEGEGVTLTKEGKEGLYELLSLENRSTLFSYLALTEYKTDAKSVNLLEKTVALYDAYERLELASKEAEAVIKAIADIGKVHLDSQSKISVARQAYESWSDKFSIDHYDINGDMISNYSALVQAEKEMETLPEKAKADAKKVREAITALLARTIVYSDTDAGVGKDIDAAYKIYEGWIETYGSFADTYINDGTNYGLKLESYKNEYLQIKAMADNINEKIKDIRATIGRMTYENYNTFSSQLDNDYKSLQTLYKSFESTNAYIVDKVSEFDLVSEEILVGKFNTLCDRFCVVIQTECDGYIAKISTDISFSTHRSELKSLTATAKKELKEVLDLEKTIEENSDALEKKYLSHSDKLKASYNSYCFDLELYNAKKALETLGDKYVSPNFIEKRDEIITGAISELDSLSKNATLEGYKNSIQAIIQKATADLEAASKQ